MQPRDLFQQHRSEFRGRPCAGFKLEVFPDLCRGTALNAGEEGWITSATLEPATAGGRIEEQIRYFDGIGQAFEWKLFDFDTPASLKQLLEARGFGCDAPEAFLVLALESWADARPVPAEVRIEKVRDEQGIRDFVAVQETVWNQSLAADFARYRHELHATPDVTSFYCAPGACSPRCAAAAFIPRCSPPASKRRKRAATATSPSTRRR
jgi:hypothetical protein